MASADMLDSEEATIIAANAKDLENAPSYGLDAAAIDRLRIDKKRLTAISDALRQVASLPDPIGEVIDGYRRPNGIRDSKGSSTTGRRSLLRLRIATKRDCRCSRHLYQEWQRGYPTWWKRSHPFQLGDYSLLAISRASARHSYRCRAVRRDHRSSGGWPFLGFQNFIDVAIPRGGEG